MTDPRLQKLLDELARPVPAPPDRREEQLKTLLHLIASALRDDPEPEQLASTAAPGYA